MGMVASLHTNLLTQDRTHRQLETVPGPGDAHARAPGEPAREPGVGAKAHRDGLGVRTQIE